MAKTSQKTKEAKVMTEPLFFRDAITSTGSMTQDAQVS